MADTGETVARAARERSEQRREWHRCDTTGSLRSALAVGWTLRREFAAGSCRGSAPAPRAPSREFRAARPGRGCWTS